MRRVRLALDRQDAQARGHLINRDDRAGVKLVRMLVAAGIPLKTTISTSTGSLVTGSSNNARSTIAIETHIMIFVSMKPHLCSEICCSGARGSISAVNLPRKGADAGSNLAAG